MANLIIVFIPGGMGTKLFLDGVAVWDFDPNPLNLNVAGVRMITDPALLLPWLKLDTGGLLSSYDDLISFFNGKGYSKNNGNLYLFGYDWRQGFLALASKLKTLVNGINLSGRKVFLVAHSYGCMIARAALTATPGNAPMINPNVVQQLVAAGPPMLGMASAFRDMVQMPSVGTTLDKIWGLFQQYSPKMADQIVLPLCRALATVTAELEGIPENSIPILKGGTGGAVPYGAFSWGGWPDSLQTLLNTVQANRAALDSTVWSSTFPVATIASQSFPTDTGYDLNLDDSIMSAWPTGPGDGSVLLTSAQAFDPGGDFLIVKEAHETLLDDPASRTLLSGLI